MCDRIGLWTCRCIVSLLSVVGVICIILSSPESSWLVWIGYSELESTLEYPLSLFFLLNPTFERNLSLYPLFYGISTGVIYSYIVLMDLYPKNRAFVSQLISVSFSLVYVLYIWYQEIGRVLVQRVF